MLLKTSCPSCQATVRVREDHVAKRVRCPQCKSPFDVKTAELAVSHSLADSQIASETIASEPADTRPQEEASRSAVQPLGRLGRFHLREVLGQGASGRVYRAFDPQLDREVALKVPLFGPSDTKRVRRFLAEAKSAARLRHPNIVPVYESGDAGGQFFIAAQFVAGQTLAQRIESGPIGVREAAEWVRALADALNYAHGEGIIHRDIKPENILLDGKNQPQIMDFGLAKRTSDDSSLTVDGSILGTPAYMSPEQARGNQAQIGPASDQYSLGAVLYELLTGNRPFDGPAHSVLACVLKEEPAPPCSIRPDTPRDLQAICQKAMCKEASGRYASAAELGEDLSRWLTDQPIAARPAGPIERLRRWAGREPRVAGLALAVAVILLIGAGVSAGFALLASSSARRLAAALKVAETEKTRATAESTRATVEAERAREAERGAKTKQAEATQSLQRAEKAETSATEKLYRSLVAQARANRYSQRRGQRFQSLETLKEATRVARQLSLPEEEFFQLRNEAIACLALPDVRTAKEWKGAPSGAVGRGFDRTLERYTQSDRNGNVSVRRVSDDVELWKLEGPGPLFAANATWSPDNRLLLVAKEHLFDRCRVWDMEASPPALILERSGAHAFSADSAQFATAGPGGRLTLNVLPSGKEIKQLPILMHAQMAAFRPQSPQIAVANGTEVQVLDWDAGKTVATLPTRGSTTVWIDWRPDGKVLAVGSNHNIYLWDAVSWQQIRELSGHKDFGVRFTFSPSGQRLVSVDWSGSLRWWDALTGEQLFQTKVWWGTPQLGPDGRMFAADYPGQERVQLLEFAAEDEFYRTLRCDPREGGGMYSSIAVSPNDRLVAASMANGVALWDLKTGSPLTVVPVTGCLGTTFDPSGKIIAGSLRELVCFDVAMDEPALATATISGRQPILSQVGANQVAANGKSVAASTFGGAAVWRKDSGSIIHCGPHYDARNVDVSPDSRWVATGSHWGDRVKIWDAQSGKLVRDLPVPGGSGVCFSPDGRWLLTTCDGCRLWNVGTWDEARNIGGVSARYAFSPDSRVVAVENGDGVIRLVNPQTGRDYACLADPHQDRANCIAFSSNGSQLVATNRDSLSIHVWNLRAIRDHLKGMGLDWDLPDYPPPSVENSRPIQVAVIEDSAKRGPQPIPAEATAPAKPPPAATASLPPRISDLAIVQNLAQATRSPLSFASARWGQLSIYLADPRSGTLSNLSEHASVNGAAAWSKDGKRIVFETNRNGLTSGNFDLYVMNADGSQQRQLTNSPESDRYPTFSPDGQRVCFRRDAKDLAGNSELFVVNVDGTGETNLTNHPAYDADPAWSPNGERIAFASTREGRWRLFTMRADGTDVRLLSTGPPGGSAFPAWSPEGSQVAFSGTANDRAEIYVIDADGKNERQLTTLGAHSTLPAWSGDGNHIAFLHRPDSFLPAAAAGSLYVMRADGSEVREIAPRECSLYVGRPAWAPAAAPGKASPKKAADDTKKRTKAK